jgi:iron(III) transport system substrate-binding protein
MIRGFAVALISLSLMAFAGTRPTAAETAWHELPVVKELYEKAKAEKEVVLWTPNQFDVDWVAAEFPKRFPGITVKGTGDLLAATRLIAEARANRHSVDVWQHSLGGMLEVQRRKLFANVNWGELGVTPGNILFDGEGVAAHNFVYSAVYAKNFVKDEDVPKTWDDLLDPKWRGKMVAENFLFPRLMGFLALAWGPERTEKWGRAMLNDQKIMITHAPRESFLRTGERIVAVGDSVSQSFRYAENGVPTGYTVLDVVPAVQFMIAVMRNAPHPNAARLLAGWLNSDEGIALREKNAFAFSIRPGSKSNLAAQITKVGSKIVFEDVTTMRQRAEFYKRFSSLVHGQH